MVRLFFCILLSFPVIDIQSEQFTQPNNKQIIPIAQLTSVSPPQTRIWIQGTIVQKIEDDTYIVQDSTGKILVFLPTDELIALNLQTHMKITVYGQIDISPAMSSKNEFYAEKIYIHNL